jgi:hypothetical protein
MTLWEKFILRTGFRNTYRGGQCTGFQFKIIIPYYRGIFISCLDDFQVKVDGETYSLDKVSLKAGDRIIPWKQVDNAYDVFWYFGDPLTILVNKTGGLATGLHTVECGLSIRKSYVPNVDPEGLYDFAPIPKSVEGYGRDLMANLQTASEEMTLVI